ncbi:MAG: hypothetical protein WCE63_07465 [Acidobacteriaceae bacterium]
MSKQAYLKRIARLNGKPNGNHRVVSFRMRDGRIEVLRQDEFLSAYADAVYGVVSSQTHIVSNAVDDTSGSNLLSLVQMCTE